MTTDDDTHAHAFEWDPDRVVVVDRDPRYGKCERRGWYVCACGEVRGPADVRTGLVELFVDFAKTPRGCEALRSLMR